MNLLTEKILTVGLIAGEIDMSESCIQCGHILDCPCCDSEITDAHKEPSNLVFDNKNFGVTIMDGIVPNYDGYEEKRKHIRHAYLFLRENNHTIPSEILDFMLRVSLKEMKP